MLLARVGWITAAEHRLTSKYIEGLGEQAGYCNYEQYWPFERSTIPILIQY
jgi:hypothetical protein